MNRFRLRQLENVLGRGPRRDLCGDCGGLDFETVMLALGVVDDGEQGDPRSAEQIIDEFEHQPATCSNCGGETFAATCQRMWEEGPPEEEPPCRRNENAARDCR